MANRSWFSPGLRAAASAVLDAGRPGFFWLLCAAVLACAAAVPASAAARGILRVGRLTVASGAELRGPRFVIGGPVEINGKTAAPIVVIGGHLSLTGEAGDDLIALPGDITLGPHSIARGNIVSLGGQVSLVPSASVTGSVVGSRTHWSAAELLPPETSVPFMVQRLRLAGLAISALLLLGLAVWTVLPWPALMTTATARRCRVRSALLGIGTLVWAPLIVAPLAVSIAGLPLAVLLLLGLGVLWLLGIVSSAVRVGHRLLSIGRRPHSMLSATLTGLICLGMLPALPVVGSLALLLAGCVGLGGALLAIWDREAAGDLAVTQALAGLRFPE